MIQDYDVAIIGAGPAGCACALALYKSGLRVVLIDKEKFPRDKICGDAIPGMAFKGMDRIRPEWGSAMRQLSEKSDIHTAKVFAENGKAITFEWKLKAYNSKRVDFDNFLMNLVRNETDTSIMENLRLEKIQVEADYVNCVFKDGSSLNAAIVIGCDGANSVVSRQLGNPVKSDHLAAAVRSYYSGVEGVKYGINECHLIKGLPGYFWIFPLENDWVNIGLGMSSYHEKQYNKSINLRQSLTRIITTYPSIAPRFKNAKLIDEVKGFGLPLWTKKRRVSGTRYLLCGDAASLIDPLQGHGIDKSIWSGLLAAEQAIHCFKERNFSDEFMAQYDAILYKKIGSELARSAFILKLIVRFPGLINTLTWFAQNQKLTNYLARKIKI